MLTFPHMGNVYVSMGAFLGELGIPYVVPPFNSKRTLEKGVAAVPEGACLPLKITMGALIEACEQGADTIVMASALGPCRFGYYCPMQKELLAQAGYDVNAIHFVPPRADPKNLFRCIRAVKGTVNIARFGSALARAFALAHRVDDLEKLYYHVLPRQANGGQAESIYKSFQAKALSVCGIASAVALVRQTADALRSLPLDKDVRPLRIGIVGEIYDNIDPFASLFLLERLGKLGAEVTRPLTVSHWLDFVKSRAFSRSRYAKDSYAEAAKPYLSCAIGGHALETIGHSVLFARNRYDGLIQIYPLGCMPEIVAQSILPAVAQREDIPVLTLVLDEQTGEAGLLTRAEAFLDMLHARRRSRDASHSKQTERQPL